MIPQLDMIKKEKNIRIRIATTLCYLGTLFGPIAANAADIRFHGFGDFIGSKTNSEITLPDFGNTGRHVNFDTESRLGLNISSEITDDVSLAGQLVGRGLGNQGFSINADWVFLTWRTTNWFSLRVGRQINPVFLYSEQIDVGYTYLWIRLPIEVYGQVPLKAFNGISGILSHSWNDILLSVQLYYGSNFAIPTVLTGGTGITGTDLNDVGAQASISTDWWKLRAGYKTSQPNISVAGYPVLDIGVAQLFTFGGTLNYHHFLLTSELARGMNSGTALSSALGAYGSIGYQLFGVLTPYFLYAWKGNLSGTYNVIPGTYPGYGPAMTDQHNITGGVNLRVNQSTVIKAEYSRTQYNSNVSSASLGADTFSASADFVF